MRSLTVITLIIVTITIISGCGNPQGRLSVSGTVTLDGEPITEGSISFEPVGEQAVKVRSGTIILKGKYEVPGKSGLVPGEYLASISAQQATGTKIKTGMGEVDEVIDLIPPAYGSDSKQRITVTETGKQTFDFPIKTK
ncbi:MAG: hypothetical protein LBH00_07930 [Planctomycetaceae bacterium]|jgi:hypothetical protein|nr:hypothetical protein [Planctomycetaceae bacterium]